MRESISSIVFPLRIIKVDPNASSCLFTSIIVWCSHHFDALPIEKVSIYAKLKFNASQMAEIRMGLEEGLPIEDIKEYATVNLDAYQMSKARRVLEEKHGITDNTSREKLDLLTLLMS